MEDILNQIILESLEEAKAYEFTDEEIFAKAAEMGKKQPEEGQVEPPKQLKMVEKASKGKKGDVYIADKSSETADEAVGKAPKLAKSIRWGDPLSHLRPGNLGRHSYTSSVNEYYDEALSKSKEKPAEVLKKSVKDPKDYDLNDLIEKDLTKSWNDVNMELGMEEFKKSQGSFTKKTFDESELRKSLGMTLEEAEKVLKE